MRNIGITGHIHLKRQTADLVRRALAERLGRYPAPVHGITCLAPGTDQIFAEEIGRIGGSFDVVVPATDYAGHTLKGRERTRFEELLAQARSVIHTGHRRAGPEAYARANALLVARCSELIAVWDGEPDARPGTTAHAVSLAGDARTPVIKLWPAGAHRTRILQPEFLPVANVTA